MLGALPFDLIFRVIRIPFIVYNIPINTLITKRISRFFCRAKALGRENIAPFHML